MRRNIFLMLAGLVLFGALLVTAAAKLKGNIAIDGSSTVFPITEAVAEEFGKVQPGVKVTVGISGTGGGFKKFTTGETDISRRQPPDQEGRARGGAKGQYQLHRAARGL